MAQGNSEEIKKIQMNDIDAVIRSLARVGRTVMRKNTSEKRIKQCRGFAYIANVIFRGFEVRANLEKIEEIMRRLTALEEKNHVGN